MPPQPSSGTVGQAAEYSGEERKTLLQLAHKAIIARLNGASLDLAPPNPHLGELRGAFTTLQLYGQLRGCIGYPLAIAPLYQTVAETAVAAAFEDPRFCPVDREEAKRLKIDISVLSPLEPIAPEDVVVGKHGLVVSYLGRRGLLLPQVPVELQWDRLMFLAQTCVKAGVAPDAWMKGAKLEAFTAEVFGEE